MMDPGDPKFTWVVEDTSALETAQEGTNFSIKIANPDANGTQKIMLVEQYLQLKYSCRCKQSPKRPNLYKYDSEHSKQYFWRN